MTDSEFLNALDETLAQIERAVEDSGADIESSRSGPILSLEFEDRSRIVINGQPAIQELWVAARSGGYHYRQSPQGWVDTRTGCALFTALSEAVSLHAGQPVDLRTA